MPEKALRGPQPGVFGDVIPEGVAKQMRMDVGGYAGAFCDLPTVRQIACALACFGYSFQRVLIGGLLGRLLGMT